MAAALVATNRRAQSAATDSASPFADALRTSQDPSRWLCSSCGSTSDVWISLLDGTAWCSCEHSADEDHVQKHLKALLASKASSKSPTAPLFMRISTPQEVRNMTTGKEVKIGERKSDDTATVSAVIAIRSRLRQLQTMGGDRWAQAKGWEKIRLAVKLFSIPFLTRQAQLDREKRDRQATALRQWIQVDRARAFRKWKEVTKSMAKAASAAAASASPTVGQKRSHATMTLLSGASTTATTPSAVISPLPSDAVPFFPSPKSQAEKLARTGLATGLRNLGNNCYSNSTLQSLAHVPLFRAWLFSLQAPSQQKVESVLRAISAGDYLPDLNILAPPTTTSTTISKPAVSSASSGAGRRGGGGAGGSASSSSLSLSLSSADAAALASMPAAPPSLMRLNSGLVDVLDFGPNPHAALEASANATAAGLEELGLSVSRPDSPSTTATGAGRGAGGGGGKLKGGAEEMDEDDGGWEQVGKGKAKDKDKSKGGKANAAPATSVPASPVATASKALVPAASATKDREAAVLRSRLMARQLTMAVHEVVSRLFGFPSMAIISPDAFLRTMWINLPSFSGFVQHDAEEFCRALLVRIDDEHKAATGTSASAPALASQKSGAAASGKTAAATSATPKPAATSPLENMLGGSVSVGVTCSVCKTESKREEPFFGPLTVEVPPAFVTLTAPGRRGGAVTASGAAASGAGGTAASPSTTLDACFDSAFSEETLEGDNAFECSKCKKKTKAILSRKLSALPPVLIVHVLRTSWLHGGKKVQTPVRPSLEGSWDLSPWLRAKPSTTSSSSSAGPSSSCLYDLYALTEHSGAGIKQGHYYSYCRNGPNEPFSLFNDSRVTSPVPLKEVQEAQGYLFYFQRRLLLPRVPAVVLANAGEKH